jgi:geranylgeranyl diphosphate synthase type I
MHIEAELKAFKARLDPKISAYFDMVLEHSAKEDDLIAEALGHAREIVLSGGKRLRAAFMYYGYLGAGGMEEERILDTSVSVELIHAFLLVHDDIIDRDEIRHGIPTLHRRYADFGKRFFPEKDTEHFGNSIALIMGDMLCAFGNDIIFRSAFPHQRVFQALSQLQRIVSYTVIGQARDVYMEYKREATEEEIIKMYTNKTAKYTVEGPLHLGAILAGAPQELLDGLSAYAVPLGIAFQIQDDILGVFGTEKRIGKPIGSDIEEGKITILVSRALRGGTPGQKKRIK